MISTFLVLRVCVCVCVCVCTCVYFRSVGIEIDPEKVPDTAGSKSVEKAIEDSLRKEFTLLKPEALLNSLLLTSHS